MQFGRALDRVLLAILEAAPEHGPTYLLKLDLSDGFYRIPVRPADAPKLALTLPCPPGEQPSVAIPLVLRMGWTESPPWFCSATETIIDLATYYVGTQWDPPPHHLEAMATSQSEPDRGAHPVITEPAWEPTVAPQRVQHLPPRWHRAQWRGANRRRQPARHFDVFVDDEIAAAQGTKSQLRRYRCQLLHLNDLVFRPNDKEDPRERKEPVSIKKLKQGDACWSTRKVILGWTVDTQSKTVELPPHRHARLQAILEEHKDKTHISHRAAQKLLGELRSMALGIPGSAGLLSLLQNALTQALRGRRRVRLNRATRDHVRDLLLLAADVGRRPTRIAELFPRYPADLYGLCDASKQGFGGVLFPSETLRSPPVLWRLPAPPDLQARLVSDDNPGGDLTNSDFELGGTILHEGVASLNDVAERTLITGCDNTPAVSWRQRGSNSLAGASAYLLREAALLQRECRHVPRIKYIPGPANTLADIPSRRFEWSDSQLLAHFDAHFPQPQPWQMRRVPNALSSRVISALRGKQPRRALHPVAHVPQTTSGTTAGSPTFLTSESTTHSSMASTTKSKFFESSHNGFVMGGSPVVASQSHMLTYGMRSFVYCIKLTA